jgi:hypothetical protein
VVTATMQAMKTVTQIPAWLRFSHVVYLLFVLAAVGGPSGAVADDADPVRSNDAIDDIARPGVEEMQWTYTRSVRIELARGEHLQVEAKIPLNRGEESRLTVSVAKRLSRSWAFEFAVWTSL